MTEKELVEEKSSRVGRFKVDLGSNGGIAHALDAAIYYGFGVSYLDEFPAKIAAVTREEADAAFARRVRPADFTIVSAGTFPGHGKRWKCPCERERIAPRMRRPQHRRPMRRRPGEAPPTHRVWLSHEQPYREGPATEGRTFFRIRLDNEPSPEWMRAYRAGLLGLLPEDRDAVLRFEWQGDSVLVAAGDAEVGRLRRVLEQRIQAVNHILSGGRAVEP